MATKPDVVTYRLDSTMVYVTPAKDYEQALDFAKEVFPDDLRRVKRDNISFSILANKQQEQRRVRIASMAWPAVVGTLKRYEIIEIHVRPELIVSEPSDGPPDYPVAIGLDEEDEKEAERARSKEKTSAYYKPHKHMPMTETKSAPGSRSSSRESAKSTRSNPASVPARPCPPGAKLTTPPTLEKKKSKSGWLTGIKLA